MNWQSLQVDVSHEVIEASTNPFLTAGWFNGGTLTLTSNDFNGISAALNELFAYGEAADICGVGEGNDKGASVGSGGPPPDYLHPTNPVTLPVTDPSENNQITVSPYWSNADGRRVPAQSTMTTVSTSRSPSVFGQNVTFTASVTSDPPGGSTPVGQVSFYDGTTLLGTAPPDLSGNPPVIDGRCQPWG